MKLAFVTSVSLVACAAPSGSGHHAACTGGKCDGEQPVPSCTAQHAGSIDVYPADSLYYYLPDRFVVTAVSIDTPISSDIFPSNPFSASPFFNTCPVTISLRPDAAADAVASAQAALGSATLTVAPTSASGAPVALAFTTIDGLPPIDTSGATFATTDDGGVAVTISVPDANCSELATLLVHQTAIASATSQRTMACTTSSGDTGSVPVAISGIGSYEATAVDDDSSIYGVINAIWDAEQSNALLDYEAQHGSNEQLCMNVPAVLAPILPAFDTAIHDSLDAVIPYGATVSLDEVHAAGQAAQTATLVFVEQVMQGCGAAAYDDATVRAYLTRTDLGGNGYTGADNLLAQTYQEAGRLAVYDPTTEHQSWPFQH